MTHAAGIAEVSKYEIAYKSMHYGMGENRRFNAKKVVKALASRGSFVDIGCGRGEMVDYAASIGFQSSIGVDPVDSLCGRGIICAYGWDLPFKANSVAVVTMFDVIEHLYHDDALATLKEIKRIANKSVVITANNGPSIVNGQDLHINKRPYQEWHNIFTDMFGGWNVEWVQNLNCISETWVIHG